MRHWITQARALARDLFGNRCAREGCWEHSKARYCSPDCEEIATTPPAGMDGRIIAKVSRVEGTKRIGDTK